MRRNLVFFLGAAVLAGAVGLDWPGLVRPDRTAVVRAAEPLPSPAPAAFDHGYDPAAEKNLTWVGVAGCSAASCHHENDVQGQKRSEFSTWAGYDPHAKAYRVLFDDRSARIVRNLYPDAKDPKAWETDICLRCHASYSGKEQKKGERFFLSDGVGCESCHGPAEKWLTTHYQAGFKEKSLEEKAAVGLRPTKDLAHRARLCAECHVGESLDRQVNHDLMAGGHPRLVFELAGYHAVYPRHWSIAEERARVPDFDAKLWAVGQIVTARQSVDLLRQRAEAAEPAGKQPWPEFTEYDCYSCHRGIKVDSPGQTARWEGKGPKRRAGSMPYATWNFAVLTDFAKLTGENNAVASIDELRKTMESSAPDAKDAAARSAATVKALDAWLLKVQGQPMDRDKTRDLLRSLVKDAADRGEGLDWDRTGQVYLALGDLYLGQLPRPDDPQGLKPDIRALGLRLKDAFPTKPVTDSPSRFDPAAKFDGKTLKEQLEAIHTKLGK